MTKEAPLIVSGTQGACPIFYYFILDWRAPFVARRCVSQRFALVKETFSGNNFFFFLFNDSPVQRFLFFFQRTKSSNINENYFKMFGKFSFFLKVAIWLRWNFTPTLPEGKFHQNRRKAFFLHKCVLVQEKCRLILSHYILSVYTDNFLIYHSTPTQLKQDS